MCLKWKGSFQQKIKRCASAGQKICLTHWHLERSVRRGSWFLGHGWRNTADFTLGNVPVPGMFNLLPKLLCRVISTHFPEVKDVQLEWGSTGFTQQEPAQVGNDGTQGSRVLSFGTKWHEFTKFPRRILPAMVTFLKMAEPIEVKFSTNMVSFSWPRVAR